MPIDFAKKRLPLKKRISSRWSCFRLNFIPILKLGSGIATGVLSVTGIVLSFFSWEEMGISQVWAKALILSGIVLFSFCISSFLFVSVFKTKRIWSRGKNSVSAFYGDLLARSFPKKESERSIIVIPVNDAFDTIVEDPSEQIPHPLVSRSTIHGMWLTAYLKQSGITPEQLGKRIKNNLDLNGYKPDHQIERSDKPRGSLLSYPLGTVAVIDGANGVVFYLLVISVFNSTNNAHSTKRNISDSIDDLLDFYDSNGQAEPLYLPLVGTGSSRANLTLQQSFSVIKSCVLTREKAVNGSVNIVVYQNDRDKISIFE
jgi:hypothetical protein